MRELQRWSEGCSDGTGWLMLVRHSLRAGPVGVGVDVAVEDTALEQPWRRSMLPRRPASRQRATTGTARRAQHCAPALRAGAERQHDPCRARQGRARIAMRTLAAWCSPAAMTRADGGGPRPRAPVIAHGNGDVWACRVHEPLQLGSDRSEAQNGHGRPAAEV